MYLYILMSEKSYLLINVILVYSVFEARQFATNPEMLKNEPRLSLCFHAFYLFWVVQKNTNSGFYWTLISLKTHKGRRFPPHVLPLTVIGGENVLVHHNLHLQSS